MVSFRPHRLRKILSVDGYYDENGDFVKGETKYGRCVQCRYEPNGRAQSISLGDGRVFLYNYTIYLNTTCEEFVFGDTIEVFDQRGKSIGTFSVQGFHRGQLDSKIWV